MTVRHTIIPHNPSPDGSGYPFVAVFDTKDWSVQQD